MEGGRNCIATMVPLLVLCDVQEARALVGWAAAILRQLDVEATKKAVVKLLECQVRDWAVRLCKLVVEMGRPGCLLLLNCRLPSRKLQQR